VNYNERVLNMKKNKKILIILILILFIVLGIFIYKNMIKKSKFGNNMNSQEIVEYILNVNSYKSNVTIQINSNKNKNKYILNQEYNTENGSVQEVIEPENIAGVRVIIKDGNLTVENTNLNLSTIFENYQWLEENDLDLIAFIEDYKKDDNAKYEENDTEIIMKTKNNNENKYFENKILYINKETNKPTKLIIEDNNQNTTINIQYNEIELN
jgi:outer membrane lipoprotein-sorting protein